MKRCILLTGGPDDGCERLQISQKSGDLVIACDSGYEKALKLGILPHIMLGDFDSYTGEIDPSAEVITVPARKNDTDTMLGLRTGLARGYRKFLIVGGLGGRLDHTIANIQSLSFLLDHEATGEIVTEKTHVRMIRNSSITIDPLPGRHLSVFAFGGVCTGVDLIDVSYPLTNHTLDTSFALGVSNAFTDRPAKVCVKNGTLLIVTTNER